MEVTYKYDVFLSFSSRDIDFVKPIREKLTNSGLKVFFSDEDFKKIIGLDFPDEIEIALKQSHHFVLVCTPNAMNSEWVKDEYKAFYYQIYKKSMGKRRFIILEGPNFDADLLPIFLKQLQTAKSVEDIIIILADKEIMKKSEKIESTPPVPPKPGKPFNASKRIKSKRSIIIKGFGIAAVLAALVISLYLVIKPQKTPGIVPNKTSQILKSLNQGDSKKESIDVNIFSKVRKMMDKVTQPGKALPQKPGEKKLYVSHLSFMDAQTLSTMAQTEMAALIDEAVIKGMNMGKRTNPELQIDAAGHEIPNTDANVNYLVNITFDPNLTKVDKITRIIDEIMNPYGVDIIVTGHYIDDAQNPLITIRPFLFVKSNSNIIISKNLQFKKEELTCKDPHTGKTILCKKAFDEIALAVKELLEQL